MNHENYDFSYLKGLLNELKEAKQQELWIVGNNLKHAEEVWKRIRHHFETKHVVPRFISNSSFSLDGLNPMNARIVLLDRWWQNKNAVNLLKHFIPLARQCRQISNI
ncbi:hypothetical protein P9Y62_12785 [Bacillus thuringiensis]|uniref:Uncharacterized protein n=1 Tax=Bacillus thuringiensis HD-771 TaxID=1218175 RepID=A0A9W3JNL5_BACTU|nr:hypothetical protein [Bacillus thuringiensis]AFQ19391.1 hypothetical protein BTG_29990 [Bacillus thuringiensis HD-771]MEB4893917.1 hypothetical protein [Bacillus thuringiensis]MEC2472775.1 hypothetical protein [Bacillus thuringiensis]MEC2565292.1 hypothetical protein [Bacillus thuringiensis]MEC2723042.1 hypothetical protein [Bacillus thuringiensis]